MLLDECATGRVDDRLGNASAPSSTPTAVSASTIGSANVAAPALVIATGGPSIPKMGATGFAYDLARRFGLKVVEPRPALVPLTLGGEEALFRTLSGVSAEVVARCGKAELPRGRPVHPPRPVRPGDPADLLLLAARRADRASTSCPIAAPDWLIEAKRAEPRAALPQRCSPAICPTASPKRSPSGSASTASSPICPTERSKTPSAASPTGASRPNGTEGFAKAEVTAGGIATDGLSSQTMEAANGPGLYAIGEAVDVTGWLGGYNFQWAWASGWAAGQVL